MFTYCPLNIFLYRITEKEYDNKLLLIINELNILHAVQKNRLGSALHLAYFHTLTQNTLHSSLNSIKSIAKICYDICRQLDQIPVSFYSFPIKSFLRKRALSFQGEIEKHILLCLQPSAASTMDIFKLLGKEIVEGMPNTGNRKQSRMRLSQI